MIDKDRSNGDYVPPVPKKRVPRQQLDDDLGIIRRLDRMLTNAVLSVQVHNQVLHPRERQAINDLARTLATYGRDK